MGYENIDEAYEISRFDLYGALWLFCMQYHSGQDSRGYRILSRLREKGYNPGAALQFGKFETPEQAEIFNRLLKYKYDI